MILLTSTGRSHENHPQSLGRSRDRLWLLGRRFLDSVDFRLELGDEILEVSELGGG